MESNAELVELVAQALLDKRKMDGDALAEALAAHTITNLDRPTEILVG